jgi:hypothetical protein
VDSCADCNDSYASLAAFRVFVFSALGFIAQLAIERQMGSLIAPG